MKSAQPRISYVVCANPRSGSSLLCEGLKSTGITGRPEEYFWQADEPFWRERWDTSSYEEYVMAAISEGTTPNGVFGAKVMWSYFSEDVLPKLRQLPGRSRMSASEILSSVFPNLRYIFVRRRNRVRQAVSWERAHQTGIWFERPTEQRPQVPDPIFDFQTLDRLVAQIAEGEEAWRRFFVEAGVDPLEIVYEDFVQAYEETVRRVLRYLQIPMSLDIPIREPPLRKQADEGSMAWVRCYHDRKSPKVDQV